MPDRWVNPHGWDPRQDQPPRAPSQRARHHRRPAPPRPPLVPQGAARHPGSGSGAGVAVHPGRVGRRATDPARQPCCAAGSPHEHRPGHDGGCQHRRPDHHDPPATARPATTRPPTTAPVAATTQRPTTSARPPRTTVAPSLCEAPANRTATTSAARRAHHRSGARRLRRLRLHRQLRQRDRLHGGVPRRQVQPVRRPAGCLLLSPRRLAARLRRLSRPPHRVPPCDPAPSQGVRRRRSRRVEKGPVGSSG
jgi:hypothetical protein